jgi:hypothetical protein
MIEELRHVMVERGPMHILFGYSPYRSFENVGDHLGWDVGILIL